MFPSTTWRAWSPAACAMVVVLALGAGYLADATRNPAHGQAQAPPAKWDYLTQTVDAPALQAKLNEFTAEGWELVSILAAESLVDPGTDNRPRLIVEKMHVTARRRQP